MTANTEEETFRLLKRSSFDIVEDEINKNYIANRFTFTGSALDILYKHHWTYDEYIAVTNILL